ncbi:MAG: helix-turn-helix transcriptional regulator [Spirochaetales bacterium]|nr:helix-turn-helix transcriptional regulator [Spirochaetales bacterium]
MNNEEVMELKKEVVKEIIKNEWKQEESSELKTTDDENQVFLKKQPTAIAMRIFRENEDYETQVMRECEAFFNKYGVYPNAIVSNPETFNRWQSVIEDSAAENAADDFLENITFDQIRAAETIEGDCEWTCSNDKRATVFKTDKYELFLLDNSDYQDGVYQLFNGYSPVLENGKFTFPLIDMVATGKKIREIMDEQGITPVDVQNVCGLGSLQAVYKWFGGKSVPSVDNLGILSNLLNTPIDDLLVFKNRED